jgi:carbon storage regulator
LSLADDSFVARDQTQEGANMLVLSRQRDETIMIGDDIEVTVVDIRGDKVRLGINAPKEISVHRKEVYDAIRRENRAAAQVKPEDLPGGLGKIGPQKTPQSQRPPNNGGAPQPQQQPAQQQPQPPGQQQPQPGAEEKKP